jgi:hypothetical protein
LYFQLDLLRTLLKFLVEAAYKSRRCGSYQEKNSVDICVSFYCNLFCDRLLYASSIPEDLPEEDPEGPDVTLHSVLVVQNGLCAQGEKKKQNLAENLGIMLEDYQKLIETGSVVVC